MDLVSYLMSSQFWASICIALLAMFYVGYEKTGPRNGRMKAQINFVSGRDKLLLGFTFLVVAVVANLVAVAVI